MVLHRTVAQRRRKPLTEGVAQVVDVSNAAELREIIIVYPILFLPVCGVSESRKGRQPTTLITITYKFAWLQLAINNVETENISGKQSLLI